MTICQAVSRLMTEGLRRRRGDYHAALVPNHRLCDSLYVYRAPLPLSLASLCIATTIILHPTPIACYHTVRLLAPASRCVRQS